MSRCPSRFSLVLYLKEEGEKNELKKINAHISSCEACQTVLNNIKQNETEYNSNFNTHRQALLDEIESESEPIPIHVRTKKTNPIFIAIPIAAAALLTLSLYLLPLSKNTHSGVDIGYKGSLSVQIKAKRGDNQFHVNANTTLRENDALRFQIQTPKEGFIYIFNIDSQNNIHNVYPFEDESAPLLIPKNKLFTLEDSIVLDDSTGNEKIAIFFSPSEFKIDTIKSHAQEIIQTQQVPKQFKHAYLKVIPITKR